MLKEVLNRRHNRKKINEKRTIQMANLNSKTFYVLPFDESDGGIGAIYTGNEPPDVASYFSFKDGHRMKHVEIKWVKKLSEGIFKLGFQYIELG